MTPIIYTVSPRASKTTIIPLITITGFHFTDGDNTSISLNGEPIELRSITDTQITFIFNKATSGIYNLNISNDSTDEYTTTKIIKYNTTYPVSTLIESTKCFVKPKITITYAGIGELDKTYGKYVIVYRNIVNNVPTQYVHVQLKCNDNVDISVGGLDVRSDNYDYALLEGDIVYLTNQSNANENGLYIASESAWTFYSAITNKIFIDLGATSYDSIDGDISRNIVIDQYILFNINGTYDITYYSLNSTGVLSTEVRKVSILENDASIPIINHTITDYSINDNIPKELFQSACGSNRALPLPEPQPKIKYIKQDGSIPFINNQTMNNHKLTDVGTPENAGDAVNLETLQSYTSNYNGFYYTIGENITQNQVVYIGIDGFVYIAKITETIENYVTDVMNRVLGIATETKENSIEIPNNEVFVANRGILDGFTDLIPGYIYYLNSTTGNIIGTPDYDNIKGFTQIIGFAISTTKLNIQLMPPLGI